MNRFVSPSGWYSLDYPDGWYFEIDDICTSFFRAPDGVGALQISTYETESRECAVDNLKEYLNGKGIDSVIEPTTLSDGTECASSVFDEDGSLNKVWMMACDRRFVFITYLRDATEAGGREDAEIEELLRSFKISSRS